MHRNCFKFNDPQPGPAAHWQARIVPLQTQRSCCSGFTNEAKPTNSMNKLSGLSPEQLEPKRPHKGAITVTAEWPSHPDQARQKTRFKLLCKWPLKFLQPGKSCWQLESEPQGGDDRLTSSWRVQVEAWCSGKRLEIEGGYPTTLNKSILLPVQYLWLNHDTGRHRLIGSTHRHDRI